jgi:hypothetical protein
MSKEDELLVAISGCHWRALKMKKGLSRKLKMKLARSRPKLFGPNSPLQTLNSSSPLNLQLPSSRHLHSLKKETAPPPPTTDATGNSATASNLRRSRHISSRYLALYPSQIPLSAASINILSMGAFGWRPTPAADRRARNHSMPLSPNTHVTHRQRFGGAHTN